MKRYLYIFIALLTLGLTACETKKEKEKLEQEQPEITNASDSINYIIAQKDNELNDMVLTFNEIQEGIVKINEAQGRISETEQTPDASKKEAILEDMRTIQTTLELNKQLIANLQQQLKEATSTSAILKNSLEQTIVMLTTQVEAQRAEVEQLKKELAAKDITIAQQGEQIDELNSSVKKLVVENNDRARTINSQDKEMHTAYYVFGTKKELKNENILKDGDVLQQANFNKDYFTKIDTRVDRVVKLYSKSATLKTNHPAGSYTLEKDAKGQYVLRINDPDRFWSVSKYLVIIVK